jgi:hypothetical protein
MPLEPAAARAPAQLEYGIGAASLEALRAHAAGRAMPGVLARATAGGCCR